jgi:hypothetical protein
MIRASWSGQKLKEECKMGEELVKETKVDPKLAKEIATDFMSKEIDPFEVRGVPDKMEVYWGNTQQARLEREKWGRGFEVVGSEHKSIKTLSQRPDGTHVMGDAILLIRPKEMGDREREALAERSKANRKEDRQQFEEEGRKAGVPTFDENRRR